MKQPKLRTLSDAKKDTWAAFSKFIRARDCLKTTGTIGRGVCYTCGNIYDFKKLQAGHLVPGRSNAVLFDEVGVRCQCRGCNVFKYGEQLLFRRHLVIEIGEEMVQVLENKRWQTKKYSIPELDALRHYYEEQFANLSTHGGGENG